LTALLQETDYEGRRREM